MPDWFTDTFLEIEIRQYLGVGVLVAVSIVTHEAITQGLKFYIRLRVPPDELAFWYGERERLGRALWALAVATTFQLGFPALGFPDAVNGIVGQIASVLGAAALVLIGFRGVDIFTDVLERRAEQTESRFDDQLVPVVSTALKIVALIVGVLFILGNVGVNVTSLVAGLGLGGLAVALAAQDTFRNLLGGVTIFADRPFQVGDWVVVGDTEGTVEHVGFRSSRVRTFYNSVVTVPNARIVDTHVDNMGARRWRRYRTTLALTYGTTPEQVQAFVEGVRAVIRSNPDMRKDYYIVEFTDFGAASLDILVYCFIGAPDWNAELRTRHVLNLDIMRLAEDLGVEFAFPTQTLHVASMPGQPGEAPTAMTRGRLGEVVEGFAPAGSRGQRTNQPITAGYDNTPGA